MRPTERTRIPTPSPRPAERMFTRRELLLTTWDERRKMSPGDEVHFDYAKTTLRMEMHNANLRDRTRPTFDVAAAIAFADRKAGIPDPEKEALADATPFPRRRRKRTPEPALV